MFGVHIFIIVITNASALNGDKASVITKMAVTNHVYLRLSANMFVHFL